MIRRYAGFTLIELLVVVAIIGLLISIGVPTLSRARQSSRRTVCMANMRSIGQGLEIYLSQSDDYWPYATTMQSVEEDPNRRPISDVMNTQVKGIREVFRCPVDHRIQEPTNPNFINKTYYETERTSYEWDVLTLFHDPNGLKRGHDWATSSSGLGLGAADVPLMNDFEPFHGGSGKPHSLVVLYMDLAVRTDDEAIDPKEWVGSHMR